MTERYGGATAKTDPEAIEGLVREALSRPPRTIRPEPNHEGLDQAVQAIHEAARMPLPHVPRRRLMLVLDPGADRHPDVLRRLVPASLQRAVVLGESTADSVHDSSRSRAGTAVPAGARALLLGSEPPETTAQEIADQDIRLLVSRGAGTAVVDRWRRLSPSVPALSLAPATVIPATGGQAESCFRELTRVITGADPAA